MVTLATVLFVANEHGCHGYKLHYEHVIVHLAIKINTSCIVYDSIKEGSKYSHYKKNNLRKFQ